MNYRLFRIVAAWDMPSGKSFTAYTRGETWNGWECPLMTETQMEECIKYEPTMGLYFDKNLGFGWIGSPLGDSLADFTPVAVAGVLPDGTKLYDVSMGLRWAESEITKSLRKAGG